MTWRATAPRRRRRDTVARAAVALAIPAALAIGRLRRRHPRLRPLAPVAAVGAPLAFAAVAPPGRARSAGTWALQMWGYKVLFEMPYDRPWRLRRRLHVDYPIALDRAIGLGVAPSQRLQEWLRDPKRISALDAALTAFYFSWELWPHAALAWILWRRPDRFAAAAWRVGATIDATLLGYWLLPTAPPWWASTVGGRMDGHVHRVVVETRRAARGKPGNVGHESRGANPWASMPSDHFASAAAVAFELSRSGLPAAALGWSYAALLAFALVYLGEHYVADLLAGGMLAVAVQKLPPGHGRRAGAHTDAR